ncbi:MAG: DNRLRE domain-containing protein, partial [Candidatus Pacearchaeota archaeon]|nr:DNRLRE domain-containing protein [Candidatus Pacearchaeota archaeon]
SEGEGEGEIIEENPIAGPVEETQETQETQNTPSNDENVNPILTETQQSTTESTINTNTNTNESYSEVTNESEALPKEESSPSQGEPQTSEVNITEIQNETETQGNVTQNITPTEIQNETEVQGNITPTEAKNETPTEAEKVIKTFTDVCEETCDLEDLNLNESSYTLRIEISNAKLQLDTLDYTLITPEIPQETNVTNITETNISLIENITINTTQYPAILGQPVKWKKEISLNESGSTIVELPKEARNIVVNKIIDLGSYSEEQNESEALPKEESSPSQGEPQTSEDGKIRQIANADIETKVKENIQDEEPKQKVSRITGNSITGNAIDTTDETPSSSNTSEEVIQVSINDNATEYEIEYETPAPYAVEEDLENGKKVIVSGPETIHYENVLAFTNLNENLSITDVSEVKIYWVEENTYLPVNLIQDKNSNGIYDYIEWIVPHLSNQTFEITLQPGSEGKDAYINGGAKNTNYGSETTIDVNYATNNRYRGLIEFDLSEVDSAANIANASLTLYLSTKGIGTNIPINMQRINNSWTEGKVTWNNRSENQTWDSEGGDFDSFIWATKTVSTEGIFYTWDITQLVQNWVNETYENYGIILMGDVGDGTWQFASSDDTNATRRPQLNITYNESVAPTINSVSIPSNIREGEEISLTANITDNLEVTSSAIEINGINYSLGQSLQTTSQTTSIIPVAKGTITTEPNKVLNYPNAYDNNNDTYTGITNGLLLTVKTPGVSATGTINSVKIKIIHSKVAYDTSGYVHWAINSTTQGSTHAFTSTSESPEITEFDITSEKTWTFSDFNLLTEIHINNSDNTLRIYEAWFEINYTTSASSDLWNATINTSELSSGIYDYALFSEDYFGNTQTASGNFTILPSLVLMNISMNDAQGNFNPSEVIIYDENQEVEMNSSMTESQLISLEEGEKDIIINPIGSPITQIEYENATIENYTNGIIDIDNPSPTGNFTVIYALNPLLNSSNATITVSATGNELYKCKDWNFTEQTCYGNWTKVNITITPGEQYNFTLSPEDPAFGEVIVIIFAHHLDSTRDFISDIYEQV